MGKRKSDEEKLRKIKAKIRKLEKKLQKEATNSSSSEEVENEEPQQQTSTIISEELELVEPTIERNTTEEELPEEFLLALGSEGIQQTETGDPIRTELAHRWGNLMRIGLGKEAKDALSKKYPTPSNFPEATAPAMNPELLATMSEASVNRDKRIVYRQNMTGRLMSSLGKSLSDLLKGNINSKQLIEEINDAAKLAAEIFYQDSASRKFFALSGTTKTVRDTVRNLKSDEYLFGKDCAEKIKAAQSIQKTSTQIKHPSQPKTTINKKQGNWRSPLQPQLQRQKPRSGPQRQSYRHLPPVNQQLRQNPRQQLPHHAQATRGRTKYRR